MKYFLSLLTLAAASALNDSPLPFRFEKKYYTCDDIDAGTVTCESGNDIAGDVRTHCPAKCSATDVDESNMYIDVGIVKKGVIKPKQCRPWLSQVDWSKCVQRCGRPEIRLTCPKSCSECDYRQRV